MHKIWTRHSFLIDRALEKYSWKELNQFLYTKTYVIGDTFSWWSLHLNPFAFQGTILQYDIVEPVEYFSIDDR